MPDSTRIAAPERSRAPRLERWNPSLRSASDGHPEHAVAGAFHVGLTACKSYIYDPSNVMPWNASSPHCNRSTSWSIGSTREVSLHSRHAPWWCHFPSSMTQLAYSQEFSFEPLGLEPGLHRPTVQSAWVVPEDGHPPGNRSTGSQQQQLYYVVPTHLPVNL